MGHEVTDLGKREMAVRLIPQAKTGPLTLLAAMIRALRKKHFSPSERCLKSTESDRFECLVLELDQKLLALLAAGHIFK